MNRHLIFWYSGTAGELHEETEKIKRTQEKKNEEIENAIDDKLYARALEIEEEWNSQYELIEEEIAAIGK